MLLEVVIKLLDGPFHVGNKTVILSQFIEAGLVNTTQYGHRIMARLLPQVWIEADKEAFCGDIPIPVDVMGEAAQGFQDRG